MPGSVFPAGSADTQVPEPLAGSLLSHPPLPTMAPELALEIFQARGQQQDSGLQGYTDDTLVMAELPDTSQRGAFELQRLYAAPRSLKYKPLNFTGDSFVKSNVIARVLQSEVDYVEKEDHSQTALSPQNYKFSYRRDDLVNDRQVHVFQIKPRAKRAGLFKGYVYLDAHTGNLVRTEGTVVKSPSFFIRKIEFVQDYVDVERHTFPAHLHSRAQARIIGRAVLDVFHRNYRLQPVASLNPAQLNTSNP